MDGCTLVRYIHDNSKESFKYETGVRLYMKVEERDELLIRMDERVKTVFNRMEKFETLFTNHLHHHQMWEDEIKQSMWRWIAMLVALAGGTGALGMM